MIVDREQWQSPHGYLNTALRGLPPAPSVSAAHDIVARWASGALDWVAWLDEMIELRSAFARLAGVPSEQIGVGHTTASLMGIVANNLRTGGRVLVLEHEHNSNTIPFLHGFRNVTVETCKPENLWSRFADGRFDALCISAVQSRDGAIADLPRLRAIADETGAWLCVDATQAVGWLPMDLGLCDIVATSSYKWLMGPNGPAFIYARQDLIERLKPLAPNWFACTDPHAAPYGVDFDLAVDARRFDVVPGLISVAGLKPSIDLLAELGSDRIHAHNVGLARQLRGAIGLPETGSAIVALTQDGAAERLARAGIRCTARQDWVRLAFHIYNSDQDVAAVLDALGDNR